MRKHLIYLLNVLYDIFIIMKFTITESEKNEIRGLYNLNEQGFFDAFKSGKDVADKQIILRKDTYEIGFTNDKRGSDNIVEKPLKLTLSDGPENIVVDGDTITVKLENNYQEDDEKRFYTVIYRCSNDSIIRDDGFNLYRVSYISNDDVQSLKDELKKFCNV